MVNCIMEMTDDSLWIVSNSKRINCLVNGKLGVVPLKQMDFIVNGLSKDEKGDLYAATEEGLCILDKDRFIKLPLADTSGRNINSYIAYVISKGDYLLIHRDNTMLSGPTDILYLYNKITKRVTAEMQDVFMVQMAPDGRVWASTHNHIIALDTLLLRKGKLSAQDLPHKYDQLKNLGKFFILFDAGNNCWVGNQTNLLLKANADGDITRFTSASGLSMFFINYIMQDREGSTWIATNNDGVSKLIHSNLSLIVKPFDLEYTSDISYNAAKNNLLIYSLPTALVSIIHDNKKSTLSIQGPQTFTKLAETPFGFFGIDQNTLYKLEQKGNTLFPKAILSDLADNVYPNLMTDENGNIIVPGKYHLSAVINGKSLFKTNLPSFADLPALDSKGNIWVATRSNHLLMYETHPENPDNYLEEKYHFRKELDGFSPRSITVDKNDNIWIGTRNHGIHVFYLNHGSLVEKLKLTTVSGLSDDFISQLTCDAENNIWACSALGLDKISLKNQTPVIENITRQNNIYQSVFKVVIDKDNTAWGLVSNALIKVTPENKQPIRYTPTLMVSMIKAGKDTIINPASLSHNQNNLSFNFAATSFINEKQVMYSYRIQGGSSSQWSERSNNASLSFVDLHPGNYTLDIKATFPAGRYPEQVIGYKFSIAPAWWQTWWFISIALLSVVTVFLLAIRFYYGRKLEKKLATLEKQQAIEKERTRIATDMHDDLGAGLSRIKFLSETIGIKKQAQQPIEEDISKIRDYSHEMIDKMGEIVWALNEKNDTLSDLLSYTRSYAVEYLSQYGIHCLVNAPEQFPFDFVSGEFRRNIYLSIKEALHNIVKHSQASVVTLRIEITNRLIIEIQDNGIGFSKTKKSSIGNGLSSMQARIKNINGVFEIENEAGTRVKINVPLAV